MHKFGLVFKHELRTLVLRKSYLIVLVLVPLLVSVAWLAGVYLLLGWKLNMFSVVAFPLLVGMGIDNGIHVFHRWREVRSVRVVLREVGGPITLTTLTTFIGFAGLIFANHVGIQTLGLTAAAGMWLVLLGAVATLTGNLTGARPGWFVDVGAGDLHLLIRRRYLHEHDTVELLAISVWNADGRLVRLIEFDAGALDEALATLAEMSGVPVVRLDRPD